MNINTINNISEEALHFFFLLQLLTFMRFGLPYKIHI